MLFGHCAAGEDWETSEKQQELRADTFCKTWLSDQPVAVPITAFFIPNRLDPRMWRRTSLKAGIIFDRCRSAHLVPGVNSMVEPASYVRWAKTALKKEILEK